jgi:two-component system sensor histidine kinase PilS (NtrC family)
MRIHPRGGPDATENAPSDFAWRVIGLVNLYRLLVAGSLFAASRWPAVQETLRMDRPAHLAVICALYFFAGIGLIALRRLPIASLRLLALTHAVVDAVAVAFILWASSGVESGFGLLLLLPIGAMALLAGWRDALFMAATGTVAVLAQQVARQLMAGATEGDYVNAGLLGTALFFAALLPRALARRLVQSEELVRRQEVDLANLAQLSQYIVQHLRESILVVDEEDRIRLINEPAAQVLGSAEATPGALLGECSPRLLFLLAGWRARGEAQPGGSFAAADGARLIQPHFAHLGSARPGPVLVFLEDTSLIAEKVQQTKLAALGRLSASIAHEIRTPVGAMSHAGQLLAESPDLPEGDRRLTQIIQDNAERVSRIIENVLDLSRRNPRQAERIELGDWLEAFREEFCDTQQVDPARLVIAAPPAGQRRIEVSADATQLQQILWNLCRNAHTHGRARDGRELPVEIRYGRIASSGRPFVEVADRGPGIAREDLERVFEPFFTRAAQGTGLGLFLARELATANGATLLHESPVEGGSLFRLVFTDPARWGELR